MALRREGSVKILFIIINFIICALTYEYNSIYSIKPCKTYVLLCVIKIANTYYIQLNNKLKNTIIVIYIKKYIKLYNTIDI